MEGLWNLSADSVPRRGLESPTQNLENSTLNHIKVAFNWWWSFWSHSLSYSAICRYKGKQTRVLSSSGSLSQSPESTGVQRSALEAGRLWRWQRRRLEGGSTIFFPKPNVNTRFSRWAPSTPYIHTHTADFGLWRSSWVGFRLQTELGCLMGTAERWPSLHIQQDSRY